MANEEHLELLKQGMNVWNQWRQSHSEIRPDLSHADLSHADLSHADLSFADLSHADLSFAILSGADLGGASFSGANLSQADLSGASLIEAYLSFANLSRADLRKANLKATLISFADLSGADLSGADLSDATLRDATLSRANLSEAVLSDATLRDADLSGVDLSGAILSDATLRDADLSGADLSFADLSGATLIGTKLINATLKECRIYGISVWDIHLNGAEQLNLIITPEGHPTITVDELEVAQFIYLLLNHQKLRNVLNAITKQGVLILGRFGGGGLEVLQAIAVKLREMSYLPIIFDFERPDIRNYTETVKTLAGLSRFVIADLSGPSVPQELYATVPHFKIPFVPIIEAGRKPYAMIVDLLEYPWVIKPPVEFTNTDELLGLIPAKVVAPAEEQHQARQHLLDELFT